MQRPLLPVGPARPVSIVVGPDIERPGYTTLIIRWHHTDGQPHEEERYVGLTIAEAADVLDAVVNGAEPY